MNNTLYQYQIDRGLISPNKILLFVLFPLGVALFIYWYFQGSQKEVPQRFGKTGIKKCYKLSDIVPVDQNFQWDTSEPIKSLPFKNGPYKLTMGIRSLDIQDWLLIEPSYLNMIDNKKKIVTNNHPDYPADKDLARNTVFLTDEAVPAIREFYLTVVEYLCRKYPMIFEKGNDVVYNRITGDRIPLVADGKEEYKQYLIYLARTIEEDFIILLKDSSRESEENGTEYYFKGGVFAFAAGFNPRDRFDTPLSFIHHPIPGYEQKLKLSMNRFFDKIEPGQFVTRNNFSVQTHNKLYVDDNNKGHNLGKDEIQEPLDIKDLDFDKQVHYRSERQVLTKLSESGAVIFTIRTYLMPMSDLKREGPEVCERFIGAINGLPDDIAYYKRAKEWGPPVIEYLLQPF